MFYGVQIFYLGECFLREASTHLDITFKRFIVSNCNTGGEITTNRKRLFGLKEGFYWITENLYVRGG